MIFAWFACAPLAYAGNGLIVAPGQSVTLVDASAPSMHIVVSAPADAALDLGALLAARGKSSILSIVTGAQVKSAVSMVKSPDGTISITAAPAPAAPQALLADGAVLVETDRGIESASAVTHLVIAASPRSRVGRIRRAVQHFGRGIGAFCATGGEQWHAEPSYQHPAERDYRNASAQRHEWREHRRLDFSRRRQPHDERRARAGSYYYGEIARSRRVAPGRGLRPRPYPLS